MRARMGIGGLLLLMVLLVGALGWSRAQPTAQPPPGGIPHVAGGWSLGTAGLRPISVAVDPDRGRAYVANVQSASLTVHELATGRALAQVSLPSPPRDVALNPQTREVVVSSSDGVLRVIDPDALTITAEYRVGPTSAGNVIGHGLWGLTVHPHRAEIYVADATSQRLVILDATTGSVVAEIPVPQPWGVAVNPETDRLYVVSRNNLVAIDASTRTVIATVPVSEAPHIACLSTAGGATGLAVDARANRIYVGTICAGPGTLNLPFGPPTAHGGGVVIIEGDTHTVQATVRVPQPSGPALAGVAVDPTTGRVYVAGSEQVFVMDPQREMVIDTLTVAEDQPGGIHQIHAVTQALAVAPEAGRLLLVQPTRNTIAVVDTTTHTLVGREAVGWRPQALVVDPHTDTVYVASRVSNSVLAVDPAIGMIQGRVTVPQPGALALDPSRSRLYISQAHSGAVTMLDGLALAVHATVLAPRPPRPAAEGSSVYRTGDGCVGRGLAVHESTDQVYLAWSCQTSLSIWQGDARPAVSVALEAVPSALGLDAEAARVYVGLPDQLAVVDAAARQVIATIPLPAFGSPRALEVNPQSGWVYVLPAVGELLSVVDGRSAQRVGAFRVRPGAEAVAVSAATERLYVAHPDLDTVSVWDGRTGQLLTRLAVPGRPVALAADAATTRVYVLSETTDTLTVIEETPASISSLADP
jgi:YVTN family beta-propeller protein